MITSAKKRFLLITSDYFTSIGGSIWLAVFCSNERQKRGREVFLLQRKKILGLANLSGKRLPILDKTLKQNVCVGESE